MKVKVVDGEKGCPITIQTGCVSHFRNQMLGDGIDSLKLLPYFETPGFLTCLPLAGQAC